MRRLPRPRSERRLSRRLGVFGLLVPVLLVALSLIACHPLVNPADPRSITYAGTPTEEDPDGSGSDPEPLLPAVAKWELAARHVPARWIPLEITSDGAFVEPRTGGEYDLWITLSEPFQWEAADGATLWIAVALTTGEVIYESNNGLSAQPELRRLTLGFGGIPDQSRIRLLLTDRNGTSIGECELARLEADVDGSGQVLAAPDHARITALAGFAVGTDDPATVRADIDRNGMIEISPGNDWNLVSANNGHALPASAPDFEDWSLPN